MEEGVRVLVIDDSPFIFKAVKKALEGMEGVVVVGNAPNGQVGLDMVAEHHPDVVTLDVTMPVMDGIETAEILASRHPEVKVLMLSAMGDEDLMARAKALGVRRFLTKPFEAADLRQALFSVLRDR